MELRSKAINGFVWSFLIQSGHQILYFVVSIILARILLPEDFGILGMISIFIAFGSILINGGLTSSLIRTKDPDQADYSTVFYINLISSIVIYLTMFVLAPYFARFFNKYELINITRVSCLTFIIGAFSSVQSTRLNKNLQFKTQFILQIPSLIISSGLGIWLAYNGYGVWSLVWKDITYVFIATIQLWIYSKWTPSLIFDWGKLKYHFNFGYKLTVSDIINTTVSNIYNVIIGKYFSAAQLGYFTRAKTIEELPTTNMVSLFNRVAFPLLSQVKDDDYRLKSIYKRLMGQVIFWTVPILMIAGVLATPLFRFLLTEKWLPAVPYFRILVIAGLVYPLHRYNLNICYVKDRSDIVLKLSLFQSSLTLLGALTAIWLGIKGLLWSIVAVNLVVAFVNAYYSGGLINYSLKEQLKDISPTILSGLLSGVIALLIDQLFLIQSIDFIRLLFSSLLAFIAYLGISFLLKNQAFIEVRSLILPKILQIRDYCLMKR